MDTKIVCEHTVAPVDGERCVFIDARTPKAQKLHSCDECHRLIQKGEVYRRDIMKFGSKLFHHKYCEDCLSLREVFFSSGWIYGRLWEQMSDFIGDTDGNISTHQILSVTKLARERILDSMQEMWDGEDID